MCDPGQVRGTDVSELPFPHPHSRANTFIMGIVQKRSTVGAQEMEAILTAVDTTTKKKKEAKKQNLGVMGTQGRI